MIKITNGLTTLEVTPGAYKDIFSAQGYTPVEGTSVKQTEMPAETPQPTGGNFTEGEPENVPESISEQETDDIIPENNSEEIDLSEIPLAEMSDAQLRAYAEQLGVDITGLTSRKAVRNKIKSAL